MTFPKPLINSLYSLNRASHKVNKYHIGGLYIGYEPVGLFFAILCDRIVKTQLQKSLFKAHYLLCRFHQTFQGRGGNGYKCKFHCFFLFA